MTVIEAEPITARPKTLVVTREQRLDKMIDLVQAGKWRRGLLRGEHSGRMCALGLVVHTLMNE